MNKDSYDYEVQVNNLSSARSYIKGALVALEMAQAYDRKHGYIDNEYEELYDAVGQVFGEVSNMHDAVLVLKNAQEQK